MIVNYVLVCGFCDLTVEPLYPVQETDELPVVDVNRARGSRARKARHNDVCWMVDVCCKYQQVVAVMAATALPPSVDSYSVIFAWWRLSYTWFLLPFSVCHWNGILIDSAVFAELTHVTMLS